ncbi:ABC transporter substrate-binding protein [Roseomonas sp. BN140053]|uniref:ABC transporter substrate-binding protein n=1 Tax=Roseomonas sp. BN140053 TaxID=3391898 RepID=UPI0039E85384
MTHPFELTRRALFGGFATLAVAPAVLSSGAAQAATRGGRMVFGRYADSQFLDPVLNDANTDIWVLTNVFDTLLLPTADGKDVQPGLATAWEWNGDKTALTLTLRQGVKFSDGSEMRPEDVVWSLNRARESGAWRSLVSSIAGVDVSGAQVVVRLKAPDATLVPALATFNTGILPQRLVEATPGATLDDKIKAFAERPVGTGPFVVTEWRRGQTMVLRRNPHHWKLGEDGRPLPYLDELRFEIVPDDATRLLKLRAGELDGTEFVPYARVRELQNDPQLRMELWPSTRVRYLTFNCRPEYRGAKNPLGDARVRRALNHAVNKDAVIAITTQGLGKPMQSFMSTTTPLFQSFAPLYPFDAARARALLAEAGYPQGFELSCMSLSGNQDDSNDLVAVQQMWAALGVRLRIEQVDSATRTARYRAKDFQMRTAAWTNDISDPSQITSYFAYSPNIDCLYSGFKDERIDSLYEASGRETDVAKRGEMYREIQARYVEAAPILFLYETPYPVVFRRNGKGFVQIPLGNNLFEGAYVER